MLGKRHITICREGWYYLFVLAFILTGALLRQINLLVVLAGMMIAPLLIHLRMVIVALRRLRVSRTLPVGVCAGDRLRVDLTAANARRLFDSWAVVVEDRIRREVPAGRVADATDMKVEVFFPSVPARGSKVTGYDGTLTRRGRYRFGPMKVSTRFPFGMIRRTVTVDQIDQLTVCPPLGRLTSQWRRVVHAETLGNRAARRQHGLVDGEFYGIRDWRVGDSRRWIHWRTSARRNQLAVRQFERRHDRDLTLLLDLWHPDEPDDQQRENIELAVSFVATAAADLCRTGSSRLLVGAAGETLDAVRGAASTALLTQIMERLAVVEPAAEDRFGELLARALDWGGPSAKTVIVTLRPIDLGDAGRFADVWNNPKRRSLQRQIVTIHAAGEELAKYFAIE